MRTIFNAPCGITVERRRTTLPYANALEGFAARLDRAKGGLFSSGIDYPGRYSRWEFGFIDPPLEITGREREMTVSALNPRGEILLEMLRPVFAAVPHAGLAAGDTRMIRLSIDAPAARFAEEERSLQPSLFTPLRHVLSAFAAMPDAFLGLYGAFGYDLLFQFEPMALRHARPADQRDLHLYLPDRMFVVDRRKEQAFRFDYEFARGERGTRGASRKAFTRVAKSARAKGETTPVSDHTPASYSALVEKARERMRVGDVFEVVLSQSFSSPYPDPASKLFGDLKRVNPSPFEFYVQLGYSQLVGTSPEMFVRVEGDRVESCPMSGTARRTGEPMEDADRLRALITSEKDEVELTMCTDVDRNDKSRICRPGTVKLLGRRLIEAYAGLFHTVDHVEGRLRDGLSGLDAFVSHMWAVTLTGAPKAMAARIIEELETAPRRWYGGAVGAFLFSGDVNTGITIRTVDLREGRVHYRTGATLVWDSVGADEDQECRTKATAFFRVLQPAQAKATMQVRRVGEGKRVIFIDNEDSFVHTLADYFRQTGADVATYRHGLPAGQIATLRPDLVVHSPGPGRPVDFGVPTLVRELGALGVPQFGVCLGLQGMVEAFGGALDILPAPRHGKTWSVEHDGSALFAGLPSPLRVGAYHSLTARLAGFPAQELDVTARNETGLVMAIRHRGLPIAAVQFHPESILTLANGHGRRLIDNALEVLIGARSRDRAA